MIPVMCIVQEGQMPPEKEVELRSEIANFTKRSFQVEADIDFIKVKKGSGFTAAKPSSTVITSMHAHRPLAQGERVALLTELCDLCADIAGITSNDVVTSIRDPQQ